MKCIKCNSENYSYFNYCTEDAVDIQELKNIYKLKATSNKNCTSCGNKVDGCINYCHKCGKSLYTLEK